MNALTPAPNIASLFYPDDGDKNTRSSIKRYLQWLEATGRNWLQADLKDYRDYLLNSSGLQVDTAKKHMERVRNRYNEMLNHNDLRDLIQSQIHGDATPADRFAITQEFIIRLSNNVNGKGLLIPQTNKASWVDSDFHWLTHDEMDAIFDRIPRDKAGYRDAALIALMYGYGLRKFEAIAVTVENLRETQNGAAGVLVEDGKGKKTAFVQRDELTDCQPIIDDWLAFADITSGRVIEMGVSTVDTRIKRYTEASCHDFRRSYARHLYEGGRSVEYIAQQLRHDKPITSMRYIGMIMKGGELRQG